MLKTRVDSVLSDRKVSQWEGLMRKFSEAHKEECKTVSLDMPLIQRSAKQFPTGSEYEGSWDILGMSGFGTYIFPNGVYYEGNFEDGMFHGVGELVYPDGAVLMGKWNKGIMSDRKLTFSDGLEYTETGWQYCRMPDRRFTVEYDRDMNPAGRSYLTADQPPPYVPPGHYDTGDGLYDVLSECVFKYDDLTAIMRSPSLVEQAWILDNCRTGDPKPLGPRPELYEKWHKTEIELPLPPLPEISPSSKTEGRPSCNYDWLGMISFHYDPVSRLSMTVKRKSSTMARVSTTAPSAPTLKFNFGLE